MIGLYETGGGHYSDRLCSDRRYSDSPQSGRPSTSLARLKLSICGNSRKWNKIGGGRGVACIESTSLIQAPRWPRGVGPGEWGGYSDEVWDAPSSGKVTTNPQGSNCPTAPDFYQRVSIASYASSGIARAEMSVRPSVCPSVRHTPVLYQNGES